MKVVIFAGGFGTRISEESGIRPKPMVEIGSKPILWHIMKIYSHYGLNDFIICCGYKGFVIKEYFSNYFLHMSDVTFDMNNNKMEVHRGKAEPWKVTLVDTGESTMTGGRLKRVKEYVKNEPFCLTYGDGVADVNIADLIEFHKGEESRVTLTAVRQPGRFGAFVLGEGQSRIPQFREKPQGDGTEGAMINGGFFVCEPDVFELIEGDQTIWERGPMETLASNGELSAFKHEGFWQAMDTLRDRNRLEEHWAAGDAPWKVWQ